MLIRSLFTHSLNEIFIDVVVDVTNVSPFVIHSFCIEKDSRYLLKKRKKRKGVYKKKREKKVVTMRCSTTKHFVGVILEVARCSEPYSRWKTFERTKFATRLSQQALHRPRRGKKGEEVIQRAFKMHECFQKNQLQIRTFLWSWRR